MPFHGFPLLSESDMNNHCVDYEKDSLTFEFMTRRNGRCTTQPRVRSRDLQAIISLKMVRGELQDFVRQSG